MRLAAAFVFLFATAAGAQIVEEHEQTYGPFEPGPKDRAPAIAAGPAGLLLAWSEIDPAADVAVIHTTLLNYDAEKIGPIHKLPVRNRKMHATTPVVAGDGSNYFVAWLERERWSEVAREVSGVLVDRFGKPLAEPVFLGTAVEGSPALVWNGLEYRVFGDASYAVDLQGSANVVHFGYAPRRAPFATPWGNGWVDWSNESRTACTPTFFFLCFPRLIRNYHLDWSILTPEYIRTGRLTESGYTSRAPVVTAEEDDLLVVWGTTQGLKAARIENGETVRTFQLVDGRAADASPSLAGSLVVFDLLGDVFGVVIDGDTFGQVFTIADGGEWNSSPRVHIAGPGRYLVTYLREGDGPYTYLVGRFVILERSP